MSGWKKEYLKPLRLSPQLSSKCCNFNSVKLFRQPCIQTCQERRFRWSSKNRLKATEELNIHNINFERDTKKSVDNLSESLKNVEIKMRIMHLSPSSLFCLLVFWKLCYKIINCVTWRSDGIKVSFFQQFSVV